MVYVGGRICSSGKLSVLALGGIGIGLLAVGCGGSPSTDSKSTEIASTTGATTPAPSESGGLPNTPATSASDSGAPTAPRPGSSVAGASNAQFTLVSSNHRTLSAAAANALEKKATQGQVSPDKKTLTFSQQTVRLVARTGPDTDMMSFRIGGLRNPTIVVPAGATVKTLFMNTDGDMIHDLRFTAQKPPFATEPDRSKTVGTLALPHEEKTTIHADDVEVRAPGQAGGFVYLCTMKGHAKAGMFGLIKTQ